MKRIASPWEKTGVKKGRTGEMAARIVLAALVVSGLAAAVALFVARARDVGVVDEDAYISFRYAQNLLAGDGLVFNAGGPKVEGITNLLWTLVVAAGTWLTGVSLTTVSVVLGVSCGVLILLLAWAWGFEELELGGVSRPLAATGALAAPLLLAIAPGLAFYAASGLEVAFFALLITAGLYLLRGWGPLWRAALGSLILGAAAMTRPEGALVLAFAAAAYSFWPGLWRGKDTWRRMLAAAVPGGVALAALTLWRLLYYGSLVPNTAFAKAGGFEVMERWGWPYIVSAAQENWFHVAWLLLLGGAITNRGFLARNLAALCVVPAWAAYVVYVGGDYMPFHRFVLPLVPFLYVLAVAGAGLIPRRLLGSSAGVPLFMRAAAVVLPAVMLVSVFVSQVPAQVRAEEEQKDYIQESTEQRRAVGNWFDEHEPDALVARNAVGAVGYYSDVRILDMLGLNNEYIARHGQKAPSFLPGHQTGDGEYVLSREPDYIMPTDLEPPYRFVSDRELANSPEFWEEYERIEVELDNGSTASMYKRKDDAD